MPQAKKHWTKPVINKIEPTPEILKALLDRVVDPAALKSIETSGKLKRTG